MMTGQPFRIYKNIEIKDLEFDGVNQEKMSGKMGMIEFTPNIQDEKLFHSNFWAYLSEDNKNKTLTIKLSTKDEVDRSPFIVYLNVSSRMNVNFNISTSVFANSSESLTWYNTLLKIKRLEYRRVYIKDYCGNNILTSACPEIDEFPSLKLGEYFKELAMLEKKSKNEFFPFIFDDQVLNFARTSVNKWGEINNEEQAELIRKVNSLLSNSKSTLITVKLKLKNNEIVPMMITHHLSWYSYKDFDINFKDHKQRLNWKETVKSQGKIMFIVNARSLFPSDFFNNMIEKRSKGILNHLTIINELLQLEEGVLPNIKTNVKVDFLNPKGNLQEICITIEEADNDLNIMEELLMEEDYITAIPYLEKFRLHLENLAYAYTLNGEYDKAINLSNELIRDELNTVAHMTKGMALVGKGETQGAYESYLLGVNVSTADWHPMAKQNLNEFLIRNNITITEEIKRIIHLLSLTRKPKNPSRRCYCGSSKSIRKCHGSLKRI